MADTIPARLLKRASEAPSSPAYYVKSGSNWTPTNYGTYAEEVKTAAKALIALGLQPGQTVSILGFNRPEWSIFDVAAMMAGGAPAGVYTTCSPTEVQYIVNHAESRFVLLENESQWKKIEEELENLPLLEHAILMKGTKVDHEKAMTWEEFLAHAEKVEDAAVQERVDNLKDDELATFIYTSGTTGPPKGVMLSHKNLAWTAQSVRDLLPVTAEDCSLSYLPLSHIAEQMFTLHVPITFGSQVYYAEGLDQVPENLKEVQPTLVFGVPRIWEKFHAGVNAKLKDAPPMKKKLVSWAMNVGRQVNDVRNQGGTPGGMLDLQYKAANKLIFSKLKPALGLGRAKYCVSGAAPISQEILEWFAGIDIVVHEVYGQSEDTGPTSFNRPGKTKFGSVGPALPGVEVKIAEDEEILVKGPNVFMGYFKDEASTGDTLKDGWLHSGDLGKVDGSGFLHITGRKKDIIITAGGKNIAPKNIEAALKNTELISEAVVIGDRRKFLSALITVDEEVSAKWASDNGISASELHKNEKLIAEIQAAVDEKVNPLFAKVEHIRKFTILHRQLTVEDGELTPTLKVKRKKVNEHFSDEIESMYS